jgi:pyrimidine deaminase RibD-like protein
VRGGEVLVASASADDGVRHAEDLVIEKASEMGVEIDDGVVLYTTLEPCSYRSPQNKVDDCTTILLKEGIKGIVFAGEDPEYSREARQRFEEEGVGYRQVGDKRIIRRAVELFNATIKIPLTSMGLPREKKLPE